MDDTLNNSLDPVSAFVSQANERAEQAEAAEGLTGDQKLAFLKAEVTRWVSEKQTVEEQQARLDALRTHLDSSVDVPELFKEAAQQALLNELADLDSELGAEDIVEAEVVDDDVIEAEVANDDVIEAEVVEGDTLTGSDDAEILGAAGDDELLGGAGDDDVPEGAGAQELAAAQQQPSQEELAAMLTTAGAPAAVPAILSKVKAGLGTVVKGFDTATDMVIPEDWGWNRAQKRIAVIGTIGAIAIVGGLVLAKRRAAAAWAGGIGTIGTIAAFFGFGNGWEQIQTALGWKKAVEGGVATAKEKAGDIAENAGDIAERAGELAEDAGEVAVETATFAAEGVSHEVVSRGLALQYDVIQGMAPEEGDPEFYSPRQYLDSARSLTQNAHLRRVKMKSFFDCMEDPSDDQCDVLLKEIVGEEQFEQFSEDAAVLEHERIALKLLVGFLKKHEERIRNNVKYTSASTAEEMEFPEAINLFSGFGDATRLMGKALFVKAAKQVPQLGSFFEDVSLDDVLNQAKDAPDQMLMSLFGPLSKADSQLDDESSLEEKERFRKECKQVAKFFVLNSASKVSRITGCLDSSRSIVPAGGNEEHIIKNLVADVRTNEEVIDIIKGVLVLDPNDPNDAELEAAIKDVVQGGKMKMFDAYQMFLFSRGVAVNKPLLFMKVIQLLKKNHTAENGYGVMAERQYLRVAKGFMWNGIDYAAEHFELPEIQIEMGNIAQFGMEHTMLQAEGLMNKTVALVHEFPVAASMLPIAAGWWIKTRREWGILNNIANLKSLDVVDDAEEIVRRLARYGIDNADDGMRLINRISGLLDAADRMGGPTGKLLAKIPVLQEWYIACLRGKAMDILEVAQSNANGGSLARRAGELTRKIIDNVTGRTATETVDAVGDAAQGTRVAGEVVENLDEVARLQQLYNQARQAGKIDEAADLLKQLNAVKEAAENLSKTMGQIDEALKAGQLNRAGELIDGSFDAIRAAAASGDDQARAIMSVINLSDDAIKAGSSAARVAKIANVLGKVLAGVGFGLDVLVIVWNRQEMAKARKNGHWEELQILQAREQTLVRGAGIGVALTFASGPLLWATLPVYIGTSIYVDMAYDAMREWEKSAKRFAEENDEATLLKRAEDQYGADLADPLRSRFLSFSSLWNASANMEYDREQVAMKNRNMRENMYMGYYLKSADKLLTEQDALVIQHRVKRQIEVAGFADDPDRVRKAWTDHTKNRMIENVIAVRRAYLQMRDEEFVGITTMHLDEADAYAELCSMRDAMYIEQLTDALRTGAVENDAEFAQSDLFDPLYRYRDAEGNEQTIDLSDMRHRGTVDDAETRRRIRGIVRMYNDDVRPLNMFRKHQEVVHTSGLTGEALEKKVQGDLILEFRHDLHGAEQDIRAWSSPEYKRDVVRVEIYKNAKEIAGEIASGLQAGSLTAEEYKELSRRMKRVLVHTYNMDLSYSDASNSLKRAAEDGPTKFRTRRVNKARTPYKSRAGGSMDQLLNSLIPRTEGQAA